MRSRELILVVALASCKGGEHSPDAHSTVGDTLAVDTPADASSRVDVTAYSFTGDGAIDPSAIVIFYDPAGVVLQHGKVDAQGHAFADMPQGGSVTVLQIYVDPNNVYTKYDRITTIRDVIAGDQLFSGRTQYMIARTGTPIEMMSGNYTSINNAAGPYFLGACPTPGSSGNPRPFFFYPSCKPSTFDLLTLADDQSTGTRKFVWMDDVQFSANGSFTIPNTWQAMPTNTTTLVNTPADMSVGTFLFTVVDGSPIELDRKGLTAPAATSTVSMLYAPTSAPMQVIASYGQGFNLFERFVAVTASGAATSTIDWATLPVPRATNVTQNSEGAMWSKTAGNAGDARVIVWTAQWLDGNNVTHQAYEEILESAQGALTTKLPTLPAEYAADDPMVHITTLRGASVWHIDYDNVPDYQTAKQHGAEVMWAEYRFLTTPHQAHVSYGGTN